MKKFTKVGNKVIDYTIYSEDQENDIEQCPKCKRMAKVKDTGDYIHYQHEIVKASLHGTFVNSWVKDECTILA